MKYRVNAYSLLLLLLLLAIALTLTTDEQVIGWFYQPETKDASKTVIAPMEVDPAGNCRYGVSAYSTQRDWLDDFGFGWFVDFSVNNPLRPGFAEYLPIIRIKEDKDVSGNYLGTYMVDPPLSDYPGGLGWSIAQRPNSIWIVGNEPDRGPDPGQIQGGQDDTRPHIYALAYHQIYNFIKARDVNALVANAGLVEVTPGRLQYLDKAWDAYQSHYGTAMPVDIWNMHIYILPERELNGKPNGIANVAVGTDVPLGIRGPGTGPSQCKDANDDIYCFAEHDNIDIFSQQVMAMRAWMKDHNQQQKPLILSEFSILLPYRYPEGDLFTDEFSKPFAPQRVSAFLQATYDYLETAADASLGFAADNHRLVQQWLWFGIEHDGVGSASNLVDGNLLTAVGQAHQDWMASRPAKINLQPDQPPPVVGVIPPGGSTLTATLSVDVRNNGNIRAGSPFTITFYSNSGLTQVIGSAVVPTPSEDFPGMTGCAARYVTVNTPWPNLSPGRHNFWVLVDSGDDIPEGPGNETDNIGQSFVLVNPSRVFLPVNFK